jgi:hypothetical protein
MKQKLAAWLLERAASLLWPDKGYKKTTRYHGPGVASITIKPVDKP